jgi:hypothetical protein
MELIFHTLYEIESTAEDHRSPIALQHQHSLVRTEPADALRMGHGDNDAPKIRNSEPMVRHAVLNVHPFPLSFLVIVVESKYSTPQYVTAWYIVVRYGAGHEEYSHPSAAISLSIPLRALR